MWSDPDKIVADCVFSVCRVENFSFYKFTVRSERKKKRKDFLIGWASPVSNVAQSEFCTFFINGLISNRFYLFYK